MRRRQSTIARVSDATGHGDKVASLREALLTVWEHRGFSYPWHQSRDPYPVLVSEYLLRRTTRTVVARVFPRVLDRYPSFEHLARAEPDELWDLAKEAGLRSRTLGLIEVARRVAEGNGIGPERASLLELPSVGPYIADAVLLYAYGVPTLPLDRNAQRVLYRTLLGASPSTKISPDPYTDATLLGLAADLKEGLDGPRTRGLHQGLLHVAWAYCRPSPLCSHCAVREHCAFGQSEVRR